MGTPKEKKPTDDEGVINLPEHNSKSDPSGTDPNRYSSLPSDPGNEDNEKQSSDSNSHLTPNKRMISPDKGE